jgi:hypothetical protein
LLALAGVALALWFFTANDDATTSAPAAAVPGITSSRPAPDAADVRRGNVVVAVERGEDAAEVRRLAADVAGGPATPALRAAGQAVIVIAPKSPPPGTGGTGSADVTCDDRATGKRIACPTIGAYAQGRAFTTTSAADPALRAFVEYWLGRASG